MSFPVFDLHCDTVLNLVAHGNRKKQSLRKNEGHIDLERGKLLPGYCQCFACFTTPMMEKWYKVSAEDIFQAELQAFQNALVENNDLLRQVFNADDVESNRNKGMLSAVLTLEGTAGIAYDPARLEEMHKLGVRIVSLGWNEQNPLCGSNVTGGGLTDQGRAFVREAQRLGILIDVSHISDEAFWNIVDITQAPVIATHSNSRKICGHTRNLTDDMFLQICKTGGVAGFNQYSEFVGAPASVEQTCAHFLHFMDLDPEGKHIALGGDLDGCDELTEGFDGVQSYPALAQNLLTRGLSKQNVHDIFWNNALGVMANCCI